MAEAKEEIVMTPTKKGKATCIKIEKVRRALLDDSKVAHKAGGQHSGLVINKKAEGNIPGDTAPHLQLEFKCFLVDNKTGKHIPESRILKFWFAPDTDYLDKVTSAYEFFKELVKPDQFPRDYVGFIKKVMKLMQDAKYRQIKKVDVDLEQLDVEENIAASPGVDPLFSEVSGLHKEDTRPREQIVQEQLLQTLESAYPNILPMEDLASLTGSDERMIAEQLSILKGRNLIKEMEPGKYVRKVLDDKTEVKIVKNLPAQASASRPTVAVITSRYYEKLAVDAMMTNKTTFVRYKTEGESNVYTIGDIGHHKVVSTKLPVIGSQRAAQISSGNTTTRLLGTFGDVEHVFLVGVAGGVPHYTDYYKHVRMGDIVLATPNEKGNMFVFCDKLIQNKEQGQLQMSVKSFSPSDTIIHQTYEKIKEHFNSNPTESPWLQYIEDGQQLLQGQEVDFARPPQSSDKLYMNIGGNDVIEVGHPPVPEEMLHLHHEGVPVIRQGTVGSGKPIVHDDALRLDFSTRHNCIAFDTEFDQVLESIIGNRKDSFTFIRGITDYLDGSKNAEWQPYASLAAAAFMKTLIENMDLDQ